MAFHASQGPTLGLPQMIQSRAQFGYRGVVVVLVAVLFTYLAFNVADQVLLADGLSGAYGWNVNLIEIGTAILASLLAIYGHDWVHRIFRILLVVSFPFMALVTIGVLTGHAGGHTPKTALGFSWVAFMAQFATAAAYNITYAPYVSDYSRYLPHKTKGRWVIASVFFGASASAIWLISLGAWLAISLGANDGLVGLRLAGNNVLPHLGAWTAFLSAMALMATMGMNAYGGMLTLLTGIDAFHKLHPTRRARIISILALMVVWYLVGKSISASAVTAVFTSLTLMLYLLVPWTATNLVDFFFVRHSSYAITHLFRCDSIYRVWNWRGLTAYFAGLAAEIPFMVLPNLGPLSYTGPLASRMSSVDISWIIGLVVSAVVYLIVTRSLDVEAEKPIVQESERELERSYTHPAA